MPACGRPASTHGTPVGTGGRPPRRRQGGLVSGRLPQVRQPVLGGACAGAAKPEPVERAAASQRTVPAEQALLGGDRVPTVHSATVALPWHDTVHLGPPYLRAGDVARSPRPPLWSAERADRTAAG